MTKANNEIENDSYAEAIEKYKDKPNNPSGWS